MAYNAKLIQSRPNTTVEFYHPSDEIIVQNIMVRGVSTIRYLKQYQHFPIGGGTFPK